jgi:hypothetical protein
MAAEKRRRCKATSRQSGERCKNKAVRGSDYCRLHGGGAVGNKGGKGVPKGTPKPPGAGGPPPRGNTNALKHGAYSSHLPPEQRPLFEEILADYMTDVPNPSATDRRTLIRLAIYETKLLYAVQDNAPSDALDMLDRLLNRNLKALQVTRESKETTRTTGATPAEVMGALLARVRERGLLPAPVPVEADVIDVEVVEVQEDSDSEE